jgi:hypothetical protein
MARQFVRASSQYVNVAVDTGNTIDLTTSIWVYPDSLPAVAWACCAGGLGYYGIVTVGTAVRAQCDNTTSSASIAESATGVMSTGSWQHLCAVFTPNAPTVRIYHNGTLVASASPGDLPAFVTANHSAGRSPIGTANYWDGKLAEHAVWHNVLTADEIAALARGVSPNMIRPINLELYWPLWGVASPEPDLSGHSLNGTVTGATLANHAPVGPPIPFVG